jgi:hypothetical protein
MSELRELTDAELDIVGGGLMSIARPRQPESPIVKLVDEIIVDVLRILEPNQPGRPMPAPKGLVNFVTEVRPPVSRPAALLTAPRSSSASERRRPFGVILAQLLPLQALADHTR